MQGPREPEHCQLPEARQVGIPNEHLHQYLHKDSRYCLLHHHIFIMVLCSVWFAIKSLLQFTKQTDKIKQKNLNATDTKPQYISPVLHNNTHNL